MGTPLDFLIWLRWASSSRLHFYHLSIFSVESGELLLGCGWRFVTTITSLSNSCQFHLAISTHGRVNNLISIGAWSSDLFWAQYLRARIRALHIAETLFKVSVMDVSSTSNISSTCCIPALAKILLRWIMVVSPIICSRLWMKLCASPPG